MIRPYQHKDLVLVSAIDPEFQFLDIPRYVVRVNLPFGYLAYRREAGSVRIYKLRVRKEYRRFGVGTELLDSIESRKLFIIVHEDNTHKDWLLKRGFLAIGLEEKFPDGCDGIRFEKT